MNHTNFAVLAGSALAVLTAVSTLGDVISDGSPVAPAGSPKSTFVSDPGDSGFGKDPFYPKTTRFTRVAPKASEEPSPVSSFPEEVEIKGISFVAGKKLVIINYQTVAEGEDFSIRVNGKSIKGRCTQINEKSAALTINGETRDIPLPPSLQ